jgi:hypothetical protein
LADPAPELPAVHAGHDHIRDQEIDRFRGILQNCQSFGSMGCLERVKALRT